MDDLIARMVKGEIFNGFYFNIGRKEYFIKTEKVNKTKALASAILTKLSLPDNPDTRSELLYYMIKAHCQIKGVEYGHPYYDIYGKNFSGFGSADINDNNTIILEL